MIGSDTIGLIFQMSAKNDASKEVKQFRDDVDKATKDIKASGDNALTDFAGKLGLTANQTAILGKAMPIAGAAVAAFAAVAVGAGVALFALAKSASDFGSEIHDASDKTGLGAETLSSLKLAADQSGSSLEAITQSVTKFSKLIGQAAEGSQSAKDSLIRLGLDPKKAIDDLDGSLALVFKRINDLKESKQDIAATKLAVEAFGKSGADLIPVIKSFGGDMAGLIKHAKELGVTLTDADASAADDFGDSLDTLKAQAQGLANTFARQFMPSITSAFKEITKFLIENKQNFIFWGKAVTGVLTNLKDLYNWFVSGNGQYVLEAIRVALAYATFGDRSFHIPTVTAPQTVPATPDYTRPGDKKKPTGGLDDFEAQRKAAEEAKKEAERREKERQEILKRDAAAQIELYKDHLKQAEATLNTTLEALKKNLIADPAEFAKNANAALDLYKKEVSEILPVLNKSENAQLDLEKKTQNERTLAQQEQTNRRIDLENKYRDTVFKNQQDVNKILEEAANRTIARNEALTERKNAELDNQFKIQSQFIAREIDENKKSPDAKYQFEQKTELDILNIKIKRREDDLQNEIDTNKELLKNQTLTAEKRIEIEDKVFQLEQKQQIEFIKNSDERAAAIQRETDKWLEMRAAIESADEAAQNLSQSVDGITKPEEDPLSPDKPNGGFLDIFTKGVGGIFGEDSQKQITSGADYIKGVYADLADFASQAIGSMVEGLVNLVVQWAVTGDFSATAALKMAAGIAAGIAAQAGIKAIFELAEGFAALGNPFLAWTAPFHFAAAKLYGIVAGVALASAVGFGALSRATAGNQAATGTTSGAYGTQTRTGAGGEVYSSNRDKQILDFGRNVSAAIPENKIVIESKGGLSFDELFIIRWDGNGRMRDKIRKETN